MAGPGDLLIVDSVTHLDGAARGAVVVCASHAGVYAAAFAARAGVRGIVLNDAGVGRDRAGVAGLDLLDGLGVPAVAVLAATAVIGDGEDTLAHGLVGHVNGVARSAGCAEGDTVAEAAARLAACGAGCAELPRELAGLLAEARHLLLPGPPVVWALDSASIVEPGDAGAIVLTGSHANLLGGKAATALKQDAAVAVYNDAGSDPVRGCTRLPALDARGIAAAAVSSASARIGDGRSTYEDGVLSAVNERACALGGRPGMAARDFVATALASLPSAPGKVPA